MLGGKSNQMMKARKIESHDIEFENAKIYNCEEKNNDS